MTQKTLMPPARIAAAILAAFSIAFAAGCADTSGPSQAPSNDFELRAMIASDRQAIHALDERMGRIENELQEMSHGGGAQAAAGGEAAAPPVAPPQAAPPPAASVPEANAPSSTINLPLGAPPAPSAAPGAAPSGAGGPGAAAAPENPGPPGAAAGAAAPSENPAPGSESDTTTIASAPGPAPGAAPPSDEDNADTNENANAPSDENAPEGGPSGAAAESGNPEAPPPPGAIPPGPVAAPGSAPAGGEEMASVPPSAPPENAPAAAAAPRWPEDLARELQSPASAKGGAGKLYVSGLDAMKNRDYADAVQRFSMVEKKYPHSDLTEPSAYFSANALNEMGKYDQAILQYNDLVMRYPKGKYASEALLREAQAFVQINDKIDARLTLQKLVSEHPGTPQAATADAMMKSMESN